MSILDALSKHSMFSETLDTLNRDPSTAHQMKGFDFAQNFPGAVPGGINTPASFIGPALSKGYQYGQEVGRALLDGPGGITIGDALSKAKTQSDANIQGMLGKGFDMDTYNQNVKDFNIADVTFANSFGLDNLFGSSAMANEPMSIEDFQVQNIEDRPIASVPSNFLNYRFQDARTPFTPVREGITTLKDQLGNLKDKGLGMFGSGKDLALRGIGSIVGGPVGSLIGSLVGRIKESPTDKFNLEIGREFGDPYGYKGQLSSGTLGARQDPFGRNLVSAFSNYEKNRMAEVAKLSQLQNLNKFQKAKLDFGKKYLEKLEQKRQAKVQKMQAKNRAEGRGGYQSNFAQDKDFMGGSGTAAEMGSF
jgi:hypothetical protein